MGDWLMLRTISVGSCVSVQGIQVGQLADGKIVVRVDERNFVGFPVLPLRKN
jgi:hypothetical protein